MKRIRLTVMGLVILGLGLTAIPATEAVLEEEVNRSPTRQVTSKFQDLENLKQQPKEPEYVKGELIVKLKEGATLESIKELNEKYEVTSTEKVFKDTPNPEETLKQLKGELAKFNTEHDKWYWQLDKDSEEYKEYIQRIEKEKEDLTKQIQAQEELVAKLEQRQKRAPEGVTVPKLDNIYLLKTTPETTIPLMMSDYKANPAIEYAEPNYIATVQMVPNDPYYSSSNSWGQGYDDLWGLKKIQAEQAWDISQGEGVIVAVIDTGIDYNHEDIAENIWTNAGETPNNGIDDDYNGFIDDTKGWDYTTCAQFNSNGCAIPKQEDNDPIDGRGHGTHCAGTIAAVGNNSKGIIGVAPKAEVMALKGLNDYGQGSDSDLANALRYAADNGADVLSNSWGGPGASSVIEDAVNYAYSKGCVIVVAAGNSNDDATYYNPANITNVITVAASDENDQKCWFSNYGAKIDISAPGGGGEDDYNILSLLSSIHDFYFNSYKVGSYYLRLGGTSMACPHVAGLTGLILAKNPNWSQEQVRRILKQGVDPLDSDYYIGTGRINAYKALQINAVSDAVVTITSPLSGSVVAGKINIIGTAYDDNFSSYSLYYGQNGYLSEWKLIYTSTTPVQNNILYADFDTSLLNEGNCFLKLVAVDSDGLTAEAISTFTVDNVQIASPLNNDIFRMGAKINIVGTIGVGSYIIEYGEGENPTQWFKDGITLSNDGLLPVIGETLAVWDTNSLTKEGFYSLRLTVNFTNRQEQIFIKNIFLDPTLRKGWPVRIPYYYQAADSGNNKLSKDKLYLLNTSNEVVGILPNLPGNSYQLVCPFNGKKEEIIKIHNNKIVENKSSYILASSISSEGIYYWSGDLEPVVADVNNDGKKEIFVYTAGSPPRICAFNEDGTSLQGWPVDVEGTDVGGGNLSAPTIADIDGDGYGEIIVNGGNSNNWPNSDYSKEGLYIYNHDGSFLRFIKLFWTSVPHPETVVADLNHDGNMEIIRRYEDLSDSPRIGEKLVVMDSLGNILPGWPRITYDQRYGNSTLSVYTFGPDSTPAVGDLDNDGEDEIVVATHRNVFDEGFDIENPFDGKWHVEGRVYVFNLDGSDVQGFPKDIDGSIFASPIIADINHDNYKEIIVNTGAFSSTGKNIGTYLFDKAGNILNGWPKLLWQYHSTPASVGDLYRNGFLEIATMPHNNSGFDQDAYLFDYQGDPILGWPQKFFANNFTGGIIGDISGDKFPDIIVSAGSGFYPSLSEHGGIYAWNLNGSLFEGFPKRTEKSLWSSSPSISDLDNDGEIELVASSDWDFDMQTHYLKRKGSIYVWDLNTTYNPLTMEWPMVGHDPQHTGCYQKLDYTPDPTPPTTPIVSDDGAYTDSTTILSAIWSSSDSESGILEYQYMITQDSTTGTVIRDWTSVGFTHTSVIADNLSLLHGKTYYFAVKAKNGYGLWSEVGYSDGVVVDTTPPTTPAITDGGSYTTSTESLTASWASSDPESGITEYQYRITQSSISGTVICDWTSAGTATSVTASGLTLANGKTYYFAVKARNGAGLWSKIGYSNGIKCDTTVPTTPTVSDQGTYTNSTTSLRGYWSSSDLESGIAEYQYKITEDSVTGTVIKDWTSAGKSTSLTVSGLSLQYGRTYYFTAKTKNGAGLWSNESSSDGIKVNSPPQIISITPNTGTGQPDTSTVFTTVFSDADGWQHIQYVYFLINPSTSKTNCLYGYYDQNTDKLYLRNDANTSWLGGFAPGSTQVIENSYAKLDCSSTSVSGSDTTLTVNWSVVLKSHFTGKKNTYLYVKDDNNAYKNWTKVGSWTIPNASPLVGTVSPASGSSIPDQAVSLTATYTDANGWLNISKAYMLINTSTSGANCLYGYYDQNTDKLYLRNDANTSWLGGFAPGSTQVIENSYVKIDCSNTTVSGSGNTLTLNWDITFKSTFTGTKNMYLKVTDDSAAATGFVKKGTWTIQ